jgi:hypothetical protein
VVRSIQNRPDFVDAKKLFLLFKYPWGVRGTPESQSNNCTAGTSYPRFNGMLPGKRGPTRGMVTRSKYTYLAARSVIDENLDQSAGKDVAYLDAGADLEDFRLVEGWRV